MTLGQLLPKHYCSDIAEDDEWRDSCDEEAFLVLRKKLARAETEAVLTGTLVQDLPRRRGTNPSKWESANPEPLRVNKSSFTSTRNDSLRRTAFLGQRRANIGTKGPAIYADWELLGHRFGGREPIVYT